MKEFCVRVASMKDEDAARTVRVLGGRRDRRRGSGRVQRPGRCPRREPAQSRAVGGRACLRIHLEHVHDPSTEW